MSAERSARGAAAVEVFGEAGAGPAHPSRPFQHRCDIFSLLNQTKRRQKERERE